MEDSDNVSRRTFLEQSGKAIVGGTLTFLTLPMLSGCGGGASSSASTANNFDSSFNTPDALLYISRISTSSIVHYDAANGNVLSACPTCQFPAPPTPDGEMTYAIQFEGDDQSAFAGSQPSTFAPNSTPPTPPGQPTPGTGPHDFGQNFFGFFYVRGGRLETHPLKPCVDVDVLHTHLTIKQSASTPDDQAYFKFHLGVYRTNGNKCYVLYDNLHKSICFNVCFPDDNSNNGFDLLKNLWHDALAAGFAVIAVGVADWVLGWAADVLATATIGLLLAL